MRTLLSLCMLALASAAAAEPSSERCEHNRMPAEISPPLTIDEIERREMAELPSELLIKSDFQKAPFGPRYREWVAFKSLSRPSDQIVRYSAHERAWRRRSGEAGYALIRSGCLIRTFPTMWN